MAKASWCLGKVIDCEGENTMHYFVPWTLMFFNYEKGIRGLTLVLQGSFWNEMVMNK